MSTPISPRLHGISWSEPDGFNRFRFALARFVSQIRFGFLGIREWDDTLHVWPDKWLDSEFHQGTAKLCDTIHKIDIVACWFAQARAQAQREIEETGFPGDTLNAIPIHIDMLLVYLRILLDTIANVTPNLYGKDGRQIARKSFREQKEWFTTRRTQFDPSYAELLGRETYWFEILAGRKGRGLREIAVHFRGTFQLSYTIEPPERKGEIQAGLVSDFGWVCSDVVPELQKVVLGLFVFLDQYVEHFAGVIQSRTGWQPLDLTKPWQTELYRFKTPLASFWLFPIIELAAVSSDIEPV